MSCSAVTPPRITAPVHSVEVTCLRFFWTQRWCLGRKREFVLPGPEPPPRPEIDVLKSIFWSTDWSDRVWFPAWRRGTPEGLTRQKMRPDVEQLRDREPEAALRVKEKKNRKTNDVTQSHKGTWDLPDTFQLSRSPAKKGTSSSPRLLLSSSPPLSSSGDRAQNRRSRIEQIISYFLPRFSVLDGNDRRGLGSLHAVIEHQ